MRVLDLFSGIGAFSLGLEREGFETVGFCEINPFARLILAKHWPDVPCSPDIRHREFREGEADVICGGFPCQDNSQAGGGAPDLPDPVRDSGGNYYVPFAWYDHSTRSWRTWQRCLIEGWAPFLETWPRSGMTRSGIAYQRAPLVPSTTGIESGSFPTPTQSMGKRGWGFSLTTKERYSKRIIETAHQYGWRPHCHLLEWLMGLPLGWTDVSGQKQSATPLSRRSRKSLDAP